MVAPGAATYCLSAMTIEDYWTFHQHQRHYSSLVATWSDARTDSIDLVNEQAPSDSMKASLLNYCCLDGSSTDPQACADSGAFDQGSSSLQKGSSCVFVEVVRTFRTAFRRCNCCCFHASCCCAFGYWKMATMEDQWALLRTSCYNFNYYKQGLQDRGLRNRSQAPSFLSSQYLDGHHLCLMSHHRDQPCQGVNWEDLMGWHFPGVDSTC